MFGKNTPIPRLCWNKLKLKIKFFIILAFYLYTFFNTLLCWYYQFIYDPKILRYNSIFISTCFGIVCTTPFLPFQKFPLPPFELINHEIPQMISPSVLENLDLCISSASDKIFRWLIWHKGFYHGHVMWHLSRAWLKSPGLNPLMPCLFIDRWPLATVYIHVRLNDCLCKSVG